MSILFFSYCPFRWGAKEKDVEIEWMPLELRPIPHLKVKPWKLPYVVEAWSSFIHPTAKKLGIEMKLPRLSRPYTHLRYLRTMKQLITLSTTEILFDFECLTNKILAQTFV
ncbi:hypothetical protein JDS88_21260 [Bacillus cereus]|nr:hypothetical protein [Bacillus cereus]